MQFSADTLLLHREKVHLLATAYLDHYTGKKGQLQFAWWFGGTRAGVLQLAWGTWFSFPPRSMSQSQMIFYLRQPQYVALPQTLQICGAGWRNLNLPFCSMEDAVSKSEIKETKTEASYYPEPPTRSDPAYHYKICAKARPFDST